jgi:hypothetical protein
MLMLFGGFRVGFSEFSLECLRIYDAFIILGPLKEL